MSTIITSDNFGFDHTSYYYHFDDGTGLSTNDNYIALNYHGYATFWAFSSNAVFNKSIKSVILSVSADAYNVSNSNLISFFIACRELPNLDSTSSDQIVLREDRSKFDLYTPEIVLPSSGSATVDITNLVKYAAENYADNWALYFIGGLYDGEYNDGGIGYVGSGGVKIADPEISTFTTGSCFAKIRVNGEWVDATPFVYKDKKWIEASPSVRNNGKFIF